MEIHSFRIKNFRGIVDTTVKLTGGKGKIYSLVGLNESGKTTILEAINNFSPEVDEEIHVIAQKDLISTDPVTFVPKNKRLNFNDSISISADVEFSNEEIQQVIEQVQRSQNCFIEETTFPRKMSVTRKHIFNDTKLETSNSFWNLKFEAKVGKQKNYRTHSNNSSTVWLATIYKLRDLFPKIVYFPHFLFNFPEEILLSEHDLVFKSEDDKIVNRYFRKMITEALNKAGDSLSINSHIIDRIHKTEPDLSFSDFLRKWPDLEQHENVHAVSRRLSSSITTEILNQWEKILNSSGKNKKELRIEIYPKSDPIYGHGGVVNSPSEVSDDSATKPTSDRLVYLRFSINDGEHTYKVSERSLGFRWFFSFLLFTKYFSGSAKLGETIFLIDEPAANLHSMGQSKLLECLEEITGKKNTIIYSTHSHYMINPNWLELTYVVSNGEPMKEYNAVDDEYDQSKAKINVTKYKRFVVEHSDKTHYFKPILDKLQIEPTLLEIKHGGVITEGKSDYYFLQWYKKFISENTDFDIIPVGGASTAGSVISLYLGIAKSFVVLLDSDTAGNRAKAKYLRDLPIQDNQIIQIGDIIPGAKEIEDLVSNTTKEIIKKLYDTQRFNKNLFLTAFSEDLFSKTPNIEIDKETKDKIDAIATALKTRLASLSPSSESTSQK